MVTGLAMTSVGSAAGSGVGVASGAMVGRGVGGTRVAAGCAAPPPLDPEPEPALVVPVCPLVPLVVAAVPEPPAPESLGVVCSAGAGAVPPQATAARKVIASAMLSAAMGNKGKRCRLNGSSTGARPPVR